MATRSRHVARARVIGVLIESGVTSRAELARRTMLAPSTVSSIVAELHAAGLVVEAAEPTRPSERVTPGRPAALLSLHRSAGVALGLDFGKRHVRVATADLSHTLLAERHRPLAPDAPAPEAIAVAVELVADVLGEDGVGLDDVVGVAMGLPGPVHLPSGELGDSTILPGWVGVRAADAMGGALGRDVEVQNDANLGALGEYLWGAGAGSRHLVYLKVATGIGAGLILGGRPYTGARGTAGEIGHTVMDPGGPICRCGNRGCLELLAGAGAVCAALQPTQGAGVTVADAIARARAGDPGCRRSIADAGRTIGAAVAHLCNLLNPERLVVGGDLGAADELLLGPLRDSLRLGAMPSAAEDLEVVPGALGERAEVLGALGLVLRRGAALLDGPRLRAVVAGA